MAEKIGQVYKLKPAFGEVDSRTLLTRELVKIDSDYVFVNEYILKNQGRVAIWNGSRNNWTLSTLDEGLTRIMDELDI